MQARLWRRHAKAPQDIRHGQSQLARQIFCLIESALQPPYRVQRDGDGAVHAAQDDISLLRRELPQRTSQAASSFVLERMDDVAQ
jgi:hypothetical protein